MGSGAWSGVVTPSANGTETITLAATDDAGATATGSTQVEVSATADGDGSDPGSGDGGSSNSGATNQPPVFGDISLDKQLVGIEQQEVTITCNVSDPDGTVNWVTVDLTALDYQHDVLMSEVADGQWSLTVTLASLSVGNKTLTFTAGDDDGEETTATTTVSVSRHPITVLRDFSAGDGHAAALRDDGSMLIWGFANESDNTPQSGTFLKIAAGSGFTIAIKQDQTLLGWGQAEYGQTSVPTGTFTEIAAGTQFAAGIRTDGSIAAWGRDYLNYLNVPAGNDFVKVDMIYCTAIALRQDGSVAVWGPAVSDVTGVMPSSVTDAPTDAGYVDVAAGGYHCLALKADGTLVAWGDDSDGQCDVPAGTYTDVDAGYLFSAAVRTDGSIEAWGSDMYGTVSDLPTGNDFVAVWCGMTYAVAERSNGSLVCWGSDDTGTIPDELQQ